MEKEKQSIDRFIDEGRYYAFANKHKSKIEVISDCKKDMLHLLRSEYLTNDEIENCFVKGIEIFFESQIVDHSDEQEVTKEVVLADVNNELDDAKRNWLRQPPQLEKWREFLKIIKADVESQFIRYNANLLEFQGNLNYNNQENRKEIHKAKLEHEKWRSGAVKFKQFIEKRLSESKILLKEENRKSNNIASDDKKDWTPYIIRITEALETIVTKLDRLGH